MFLYLSIPLLLWFIYSMQKDIGHLSIYSWKNIPLYDWPNFFLGYSGYLFIALISVKIFQIWLQRYKIKRRDGNLYSESRINSGGDFFLFTLFPFLLGFTAIFAFVGPENQHWGGYLGNILAAKIEKSLGINLGLILIIFVTAILSYIHIRVSWLGAMLEGIVDNNIDPEEIAEFRHKKRLRSFLGQEPVHKENQRHQKLKTKELRANLNFPLNSISKTIQKNIQPASLPWFSVSRKKALPSFVDIHNLDKVYPLASLGKRSRLNLNQDGEFTVLSRKANQTKGGESAVMLARNFWDEDAPSLLRPLKAKEQNEVYIFTLQSEQSEEKRLDNNNENSVGNIGSEITEKANSSGSHDYKKDTDPLQNESSTEREISKVKDLPDDSYQGIPGDTTKDADRQETHLTLDTALNDSDSSKGTLDQNEMFDNSRNIEDIDSQELKDSRENHTTAILAGQELPADSEEEPAKIDEALGINSIQENESKSLVSDKSSVSSSTSSPFAEQNLFSPEDLGEEDQREEDLPEIPIGKSHHHLSYEKDPLYYHPEEFPDYSVDADIFEESVPENDFLYRTEIELGAKKLEETLLQFSIEAKVIGHKRGPVVTMYEMAIAPGIKVNKITNLADDIAMAFASESVRIIAPIPGKSAIGIEVPNKHRSLVRLGDLWANKQNIKKGQLIFPLGKKLNGEIEYVDLTKMPHLLIAGATGSGKSVLVNAIISSLIYQYDPSYVRLLLIDPKLVELNLYNGISHLLHPVITDAKVATSGLFWIIQEMEYRYTLLSKLNVRDLNSYNKKVDEYQEKGYPQYSKLPYLVVLIDEYADLMMVSGKELEDFITRIAQKSRAVGIHLILATQRPSVNIITGLIKANFPARIAFQVASKIDSRTIIDQNGAEKLLGKGDSLFQSPYMSFPFRSQTPLLKEDEVMRLVARVKGFAKPRYAQFDLFDDEGSSGSSEELDDELFEEALEIILESRKASASYLQRRLRIGYNRAARLIERMEELGYVGAQQGSKPREILRDNL